MTNAPQSTPPSLLLPPLLLALVVATAAPLQAQETASVSRAGPFRKAPQGVELGTVLPGARVRVDSTAGSWSLVTLEGWIFTSSTRADRREGFDVSVRVTPNENLRRAPNGTVIARLNQGALLSRIGTQGGWTRVRRSGWVPAGSVPPAQIRQAQPVAQSDQENDRRELTATVPFVRLPGGDTLGMLAEGAQGHEVTRSGNWVRIRVEGWVPAEAVGPWSGGALTGVSAAEVRANSARYVGQVLDWELQYVSVQTADELRPEIPLGERYLLTRGPAPEAGFVYVLLNAEQLDTFEAMQPLQDVMLRVRVLAAKTRYLPNPVVQLVALLDQD